MLSPCYTQSHNFTKANHSFLNAGSLVKSLVRDRFEILSKTKAEIL